MALRFSTLTARHGDQFADAHSAGDGVGAVGSSADRSDPHVDPTLVDLLIDPTLVDPTHADPTPDDPTPAGPADPGPNVSGRAPDVVSTSPTSGARHSLTGTGGSDGVTGQSVLVLCLAMLWRRISWVIVAVFFAGGVAAGLFSSLPPTQQSTTRLLFVPSLTQPGVEGPTNPLLSLGEASAVAAIVQTAVSDDETMNSLAAAGYRSNYEVVQDAAENSGPILILTTEDRSAKQSEATRDALVAEVRTRLQSLQDERSVPQSLRVTTLVLTSSEHPKLLHKLQIRVAAVGGGAALALLLGLILLWERRRRRRELSAPVESSR